MFDFPPLSLFVRQLILPFSLFLTHFVYKMSFLFLTCSILSVAPCVYLPFTFQSQFFFLFIHFVTSTTSHSCLVAIRSRIYDFYAHTCSIQEVMYLIVSMLFHKNSTAISLFFFDEKACERGVVPIIKLTKPHSTNKKPANSNGNRNERAFCTYTRCNLSIFIVCYHLGHVALSHSRHCLRSQCIIVPCHAMLCHSYHFLLQSCTFKCLIVVCLVDVLCMRLLIHWIFVHSLAMQPSQRYIT